MPNKPKTTQPETPNEIQGRDQFQTPKYAVKLLLPFIPKNITTVWEVAIGEGRIFDCLEEYSNVAVYGSDIIQKGYSDNILNFLDTSEIPKDIYKRNSEGHEGNVAIITNPPYSLKKRFYEKCKYFEVPFALLIPCDYCGWIIDALIKDGCEKIIPTRRIDYITPNGKQGESSSSQFHSMWLTWGFELGKTETFVELTKEMKRNI
jgi:hypothetical protein